MFSLRVFTAHFRILFRGLTLVLSHIEEMLKFVRFIVTSRQYIPFEHVKECVEHAVLLMLGNITYLSTKSDKGIFSAIFQMIK